MFINLRLDDSFQNHDFELYSLWNLWIFLKKVFYVYCKSLIAMVLVLSLYSNYICYSLILNELVDASDWLCDWTTDWIQIACKILDRIDSKRTFTDSVLVDNCILKR